MDERQFSAVNASFQIGDRIREARMKQGLSQLELGRRVKIGRSAVAQWERGESSPSLAKIEDIAIVLKLSPAFLAFGGIGNVETDNSLQSIGLIRLLECDFANGLDSEMHLTAWGVPLAWLRDELGVKQVKDVVVYRCAQSVAQYQAGDWLIIDRASSKPSPAGDFLFWDGLAPRVGRMTVVPGMSPKTLQVRILDDMGPYEVPYSILQVIGRVRGCMRAIR